MNNNYEDSSVEDKLDNKAVFYIKSYFYEQIGKNDYYKSLIKDENLSRKDDEFFINKDEDKSDTKKIKKKINDLYQSALQIDDGKDDWEKEEKRIANRLTNILNKEEGCCCTAF